ncbi:hypothetical protein DFQ28_002477 [Apophysomyces sp. BC1034]|nr:hypothetical protein DFQ28_002477 [Apophysomyces sp. BC1034]
MESKPPRRTRDRILELSLRLFNEIGEPNVTTTTIAEEMEISPGNLYYHFRNKDDIINSIFAQFEQQISKRLRFPDDHRATIDEMWAYLAYMADFLWTYRFLYRDLNDLLARNRTLETHFKQIITHKVNFARQLCEQLIADDEMEATSQEISVISTNIGVISTYWLSYQFVMNPRKYNDQDAIRTELHQASLHIVSLMAPYLRGRSRQLFDDLVSGRLPMREVGLMGVVARSSDPTSARHPGKPRNQILILWEFDFLIWEIFWHSSHHRLLIDRLCDNTVNPDQSVTGAERALLVLTVIANHGKAVSAKDLIAITGLAQSTLYRQIALLKRWGFVAENASHYTPGPISLQLALGFDVNSLLIDVSRSEMQRLARASQESVGLVVAVRSQVMCLEIVESQHPLRCSFEKGRVVPLKAGASAKSLLAFMSDKARADALDAAFDNDAAGRAAIEAEFEQIRAQGYAVSDSEVDPGIWGVSVPVFHRAGRDASCAASITLMAPSTRVDGRQSQFIDGTLRAARAISSHLQSA